MALLRPILSPHCSGVQATGDVSADRVSSPDVSGREALP
jgi:hypothetical protein